MDYNKLRHDSLIGSVSFDVASIYAYPNHEMYRKIFRIDDGKDITGSLKLSITVLKPGDKPPFHKEEEEYDDESDFANDLQSMVKKIFWFML